MGHVGFGFSGTRIYEQRPQRTISILLKPTRQHSAIDSNLDMSCPPWPPVKTEKRLVFVDVPIEDQTGAFYIGTMTLLPEEDRFLTASEVAGLSNTLGLVRFRSTQVKDELISLYGGAEASSIAQATIREQLQNGDLQVPCICLEYALDDFVPGIDAVLIDASFQGRVTLAGWDLDDSGRPWPEEDKQNHRSKLEEKVAAMKEEVVNLQERVRTSKLQQAVVKEKMEELERQL
ncbi:hypothetical protein FRC00_003947 [Tulasnella sp. 408]|nr:hypothetical protein FRC00_003947 [Tulasnella sp. 408]